MQGLLRAREVAQLLNLKPATIYDLAHRRVLPHIIISQGAQRNLIRFRQEDIERFLRDRTVRGETSRSG